MTTTESVPADAFRPYRPLLAVDGLGVRFRLRDAVVARRHRRLSLTVRRRRTAWPSSARPAAASPCWPAPCSACCPATPRSPATPCCTTTAPTRSTCSPRPSAQLARRSAGGGSGWSRRARPPHLTPVRTGRRTARRDAARAHGRAPRATPTSLAADVGLDPRGPGPLPARAVRRHGPAPGHRARARRRPVAAHRRRTHHRPGPAAGRPHPRRAAPPLRQRRRRPAHHPRPRRRRTGRRHRRRHVRRPHRRTPAPPPNSSPRPPTRTPRRCSTPCRTGLPADRRASRRCSPPCPPGARSPPAAHAAPTTCADRPPPTPVTGGGTVACHHPIATGAIADDRAHLLADRGDRRLRPPGRPRRRHLQIDRGETVGLRGPSGCGKSTLARVLALLHQPDRGHGQPRRHPVDGVRYAAPAAVRTRVAVLFQSPRAAVDPRLTLADLIAEPLRATGRPSGGPRHAWPNSPTSSASPRTCSPGAPHAVSDGQLQRACLARALVTPPRLPDLRRDDHHARRLHPGARRRRHHATTSARTAPASWPSPTTTTLLDRWADRIVDLAGAARAHA